MFDPKSMSIPDTNRRKLVPHEFQVGDIVKWVHRDRGSRASVALASDWLVFNRLYQVSWVRSMASCTQLELAGVEDADALGTPGFNSVLFELVVPPAAESNQLALHLTQAEVGARPSGATS